MADLDGSYDYGMGDDPDKMADLNGSSDNDKGDREAHCSADTPPKKRARQHYKTKWQQVWASKYPCITQKSETQAECSVCSRAFSFDHQGERDILRHLGGSDHIKRAKDLEKISKIDDMFKRKADDGKQVDTLFHTFKIGIFKYKLCHSLAVLIIINII